MSDSERRAMPRFMFIATAEIIEPSTDTRMSGRVSEISRFGCYIDVLNTLPQYTKIRVRILTDAVSFDCAATIIYVQENMGMGVRFLDPPKDQQEILDGWLTQFGGGA